MAGVEYSIYFSAPSAGLNTINLLKAPTTLVGAMFDAPYLGIVLDAVRTAYIPNAYQIGISTPIIKTHFRFEGIQINVVFPNAGMIGILYFGTPTSDSIPLEAYAGVAQTLSYQNTGTSATNATVSATFQFPQGNIKLTGIAYMPNDQNDGYDIWSFTTAGGLLIQGFGVGQLMAQGKPDIVPLNDIFTAQSLTITVNMFGVKASSTHSIVLIAYYRF